MATGRCGSACALVEYPTGIVLDACAKVRFVRDLIAAKDLVT